jgi:hypothetical protein
MSWGTRRRNTFVFLVTLLFVIPIIITLFFLFYETPTCFDGKQNSNETGIDCGGNCELLCTEETLSPTVFWERYFKVKDGVYNVIAYVENQNPGAGVLDAPYTFKLYNREGVAIAEKTGSVRLYPRSITPIIENNLLTYKQIPDRISFEFAEDLVFSKEEPLKQEILIKNENYFSDSGTPKVTATVENITLNTVNDIKIVVLLYDSFDNVIATSSTFIDKILVDSEKGVTFTWPVSFEKEVSRIELIPVYE